MTGPTIDVSGAHLPAIRRQRFVYYWEETSPILPLRTRGCPSKVQTKPPFLKECPSDLAQYFSITSTASKIPSLDERECHAHGMVSSTFRLASEQQTRLALRPRLIKQPLIIRWHKTWASWGRWKTCSGRERSRSKKRKKNWKGSTAWSPVEQSGNINILLLLLRRSLRVSMSFRESSERHEASWGIRRSMDLATLR